MENIAGQFLNSSKSVLVNYFHFLPKNQQRGTVFHPLKALIALKAQS